MNDNDLGKFKASILALALLMCGCSSQNHAAADISHSDSIISSQTTDLSSEETPEYNIGELVAEIWSVDWAVMESADMMIIPHIRVFSFEPEKANTIVAVVVSSWKGTIATLYRVNNEEAVNIGWLSAGFRYEALKCGSEILLHTNSVIVGSGDITSVTDTYYQISEKNITLNGKFERIEYMGTANAWYNSGEEVTEEDYHSMQQEVTDGYTLLKAVDFDADGDCILDDYFDYGEEPENFSDYVTESLTVF